MRLARESTSLHPRTVSIHASVKDATCPIVFHPYFFRVSIHASVKDATGNPNTPVEVLTVSIHASVKDATKIRRV